MKFGAGFLFPIIFSLLTTLFPIVSTWLKKKPVGLSFILIFFAALAWSSIIQLRDPRWVRMKMIYLTVSMAGSVIIVEWFLRDQEHFFLYRLIYFLILMGVILIRIYFRIIARQSSKG